MTNLERYLLLTVLGPVFWLQGRQARRNTPLLPEPLGPRQGTAGQGSPIRILITGDSAAAGVGADSQDDALCGQLMSRLGQHCTIEWELMAVTGLDSPELFQMLEATPPSRFDVVVLSIGANDVTALRSPGQWLRWQRRLASQIQERFEPDLLIHTALPPMHLFTALPQPLRWFVGRWANEMNRHLANAVPNHGARMMHTPFRGVLPDGLAKDGFHPGPKAYAVWAEELSGLILERVPTSPDLVLPKSQ